MHFVGRIRKVTFLLIFITIKVPHPVGCSLESWTAKLFRFHRKMVNFCFLYEETTKV
jgi:hypothetical protein